MSKLSENFDSFVKVLPILKDSRFGQCDDCPIVNKETLILLLKEVYEDLGFSEERIEENPRKYYSMLRSKILKDQDLSVEQKLKLSELI